MTAKPNILLITSDQQHWNTTGHSILKYPLRIYDPDQLTIPSLVPGEHDRNPPHFRLTQEDNPDFSHLQETGFGVHGYRSHHYYEYGTKFRLTDGDKKKLVAVYYGMISLMDKYIGCILDQLERLGMAENTVIVFTTDHGHFFGQHGLQAKGGFHYEDLIRIPFIVRYPDRVPAAKHSDAIQSLVDLASTFLSLCGLPVPSAMTGIDQKEVWLGTRESIRQHAICEFRHEPSTIHQKTYVDERYKITVYYNQIYGEIFDLQEKFGRAPQLVERAGL